MDIVKGLLIVSFLYTVLLVIVYFSKSRLNNMENDIYKILLTSNLIGLVLEFISVISAGQMTQVGDKIQESFIVSLTARFYLIYLLIWMSTFISYIYSISFDITRKFYRYIHERWNFFKGLFVTFFIGFVSYLSFAPMYFYNDGITGYTWGPAIDALMLLFTFGVIFCLVNVLLSFKKVKFKRYAPVFSFFAGVALVVILKAIDPGIQVVGTTLSFVTILMFFTIENPDLQMLSELKENRQLIEKSYESNANFIFNVSQEVKNPIKNIEAIYNELKEENNIEVIKSGLQAVKRNSDDLNFIVSNFLDVSSLDAHNIKIVSNRYNLVNLLRSIEARAKQEINDEVEFRMNITSNVPEILYGDEVKLKQILMTIIYNAIKFTKKGFIEVEVGAIVKYEACRLIITIEDSGCGMSLNEVNDLMSHEGSLSEEEIRLLDQVDLNINIVNKITKIIGGSLLIKSEEGKGSKFTIILEQKIYNSDDNPKIVNAKYDRSFLNSKRVLLVTDKKDDIAYLKAIFAKNDVEVITTMYGKDCVDKIANKEYYDLIIIEDEMKLGSGITTLQELQNINNKVPVVVMIDKNKERIKKVYLKDGFVDCLLKNKIKSETERIIKKHL